MTGALQLLLEHHFFPHIQITAAPAFKSQDKPYGDFPLESTLNVAKVSESPLRYQASLHVKLDPTGRPDLPYAIDVICIAHVIFQDQPPKDQDSTDIAGNATFKLLFPAIRELVLSLTARQPWGQFSIGIGSPPRKPEGKPATKKPRRPTKALG